MSKSKSRRQRPTTPNRPPRAPSTQRAQGRKAPAVRKSAGAAAIGAVALLALLAAALLIAAGGGVPAPVAAGTANAVANGDRTESDEASAEAPAPALATAATTYEAGSKEAYESLSTCAGNPCPSVGPEDAAITVIEVSDFSCSHCKDFNSDTEPILDAKYVEPGQMRYVVHVFGFNDESRAIAAAAMCANEQGRYFDFKREAFAAQGEEPPTEADFASWADVIGLDADAFMACVDENRYAELVQLSTDEAIKAGITGTPSFVVNGELTEGNPPLVSFTAQIDALLAAIGGDS